MIVFDEKNNVSTDNVTILLDVEEAHQLLGYLKLLMQSDTQHEHYHLNNYDYSKEITIALYDKNGSLEHFSDKYKSLILSDK